ncbi:MAG: hypothetical protein ACREA2_02395 [Blastocatellia bacterium]
MIDPATFRGKLVEYLLAGALGWFISSFSFQRRLDDFEKRVVAPIQGRISKFEGTASLYVTREELKSEIASLRADFKDAVAELKSLMRELRTERQ